MRAFFLAILVLVFGVLPERARANSFGDAALTVGISSAVGGILGLSTLPFYEDSSAHVRNIWIGAAIGAVIGVGISAFSALKATDPSEFEEDYEEADKQDFSFLVPAQRPVAVPPVSVALAGRAAQRSGEKTFPLASIRVLSF